MNIDQTGFSELLELFFSWEGQTTTKVARISGIPKTTLDTWLAGGTKRPRNGVQIVELCRALKLTEPDADRLLNSAGHKTIRGFHEAALKKDDVALIDLVGFWLNAGPESSEIKAPFLAPSRRIDQLFGRDVLLWEVGKTLQSGENCVLFGMPGVGKTSLAIELAYRLADRFPDGVLWANLSHVGLGNSEEDEERLMACLYTFVRAYGREANQAVTLESREVLWREVVQNKRALIILDNVAHTAVLQRLLPSDNNRSVVLVTTNNQSVLRGRAHAIQVDVLPFEASEALLRHRLGDRGNRIDDEAAGVKEIIDLVDGHPLALELVASGVAYITFQEYVRELEDEQTRLDYLADWDDVNKSVKGVFQLSFNRLSEPERFLFAHTAWFRSGHFTTEAVAHLLGQNMFHTKRALGRLCQTSFLQIGQREEAAESPSGSQADRYFVHNLLRVFALYQANLFDFDHPQLWGRLADYYTAFAEAKGAEREYALIDEEWENIQPTLEQMVRQEDTARVLQAVFSLTGYWVGAFGYLDLRAMYEPALNWMNWLRNKSRPPNDAFSDDELADLIVRLGWFSFRLHCHEDAEHYLEKELPEVNDGGNQELMVLRQSFAADILSRLKINVDIEESRDLLESSISDLDRFDTLSAQYQKGHLRIALGEVFAKSFGRMGPALATMETGVANLPDIITPSHLKGFNNLSIVAALMNMRQKGEDYVDRAITAAQKLGDNRFLGLSLLNKAVYAQKNGDIDVAQSHYIRALNAFQQIGDEKRVGLVKQNLGRFYFIQGDLDASYPMLQDSFRIAEGFQDLSEMILRTISLAELLLAQDDIKQAEILLDKALHWCQEAQNVLYMPYVLIYLGHIKQHHSQFDVALRLVDQGIQLAQSKQHDEVAGIGWSQKAEILDASGNIEQAKDAHQKAVLLLKKQERYELEKAEARYHAFLERHG